ncbi:MAG: desulfoferrodoxin [Thermofilum sp.]|jgi:superoxide reductase|uniref:Desulfoferrodoxin n=1 Tax=Thermofilum adornatum TaxID=1365176 RepID=A0A7C1CHF0_9CREN|nr:desulfoferrodoxin [Thermofilum sp.]
MAKKFGDLIYSPEVAAGEAVSKVETHTPKIEAPDEAKAGEPFYIKIKVGPHPNTLQHSIRWIEVYFEEEGRAFNPIMLSRIHLEPELVEPEVTLKLVLKKSGVIYALEYCNLHGVWEGRKAITVK